MRMIKKTFCMILALVVVVGLLPASVFAADTTALMTLEELRTVKGAFTVEAYNLGQGFLVEPSLYEKAEGKSTSQITGEILDSKDISFEGDINSDGIVTYFSGLEFDDSLEAQYPDYLLEYLNSGDISQTNDDPDGILSEFDYSGNSGWVYTINSWFASYGADQSFPGQEIKDYNTQEMVTLGDIIRWHFTVYGLGADCGISGNAMAETMGGNLFTQADKSELIFILAAINDYYGNLGTDEVYETALAVAAEPQSTAEEIADQEAILTAYITDTFFNESDSEPAERVAQSVTTQVNAVMEQLAVDVPSPAFGTGAGEWTVLTLARGGYYTKDSSYFSDYYDRIVATVNETAATVNLNGALHKVKSTENSRLILALSAIGKDATSVGNWNLITPFEEFTWIKKQGLNGPVFALLALDSHNYQTEDNTIRQQCIDYILGKTLTATGGGWALSGENADPDMTAMTLQALAPYKEQPAVAEAAQAAFAKLSQIQNDNGGYTSWSSVNSESCAQVIVACTAWDINPDTDTRFVKNNKSVVDALLAHYLTDEAKFEHIIGKGSDSMATDQGSYALVAYDRLINGKPSLYDYSDVTFDAAAPGQGGTTPPAGDGEGDGAEENTDIHVSLGLPETITYVKDTTFNALVKVDKWDNDGGYKLVDFIMTIPEGITVTEVKAGDRLSGGSVSYNLEAGTNKLRCVYFDSNENSDLTISGTNFPAEIFNIQFKISEVKEVEKLDFAITGMSIKLNSDSFDENSMVVVKTEPVQVDPDDPNSGTTGGGSGSVVVTGNVSYSVKELYTGDDVDLIPSTKQAIAVAVTGIEKDGTPLAYNDGENIIPFQYSAEITNKSGVATYVALVDASFDERVLADTKNRENFKTDGDANTITFGDTNSDNTVNAQDALAVVDAWLRKENTTPNDSQILRMNVNGDSRINTFDALGIVEAFVDQNSEYLVVVAAASMASTN